MVDLGKALRSYLLDNGVLNDAVDGRVFVGEIPVEEIPEMPRNAVLLALGGGAEALGPGSTIRVRGHIVCFSDSYANAATVDRAVYQAFKDLDRVTVEGVLVHGVALAGGTSATRTPNEGWPAQTRTVTVTADDREVT